MSISYFAALLLLGCIFTTSIGGIVRRQDDDDCSTPEYERCLNESNSSQLNGTENLQAILSFFCSNDACFSIATEYFACLGTRDAESLRRQCTRNDDGEICEVRYLEGVYSGDIPSDFDSCENASRICTTECRGDLTTISSYWGCCTATFESIRVPAREIFERCDVPLDEPCSGSYKTPMFLCMIIIAFLIVTII